MAIHTFSSRDFTRNVSAAKRATAQGPVFITHQSEPSFLSVMDSIDGGSGIDIDFDPQPANLQLCPVEWGNE